LNPSQALFVDAHEVDQALCDAGHCGPELAHLAQSYCGSPRALVFRSASSDWPLLMLMLPLASRLSLMVNPVFAQLARTWGLAIRFIGVDRDRLIYDFRALLGRRTLELIVDLLAQHERGRIQGPLQGDRAAAPEPILDVLFEALAGDMLTTLERRRADWTRHLEREHRLDTAAHDRLFGHDDRYPDFLAALRAALRDGTIDPAFYGRVLRSIDQREALVDSRIAGIIEDALEPSALALLSRTGAGRHLGCYNWLVLSPRYAAARAHVLSRLPALSGFLSETLMPLEASARIGSGLGDPTGDLPDLHRERERLSHTHAPTFDLRPELNQLTMAAGSQWTALVRRAIDAGQDRQVIDALAARLAVSPNLIRRLWRDPPLALGQPPAWLITAVVRHLDQLPERHWPRDDEAWQALIERASSVHTG
jgi:hypothetical protein